MRGITLPLHEPANQGQVRTSTSQVKLSEFQEIVSFSAENETGKPFWQYGGKADLR